MAKFFHFYETHDFEARSLATKYQDPSLFDKHLSLKLGQGFRFLIEDTKDKYHYVSFSLSQKNSVWEVMIYRSYSSELPRDAYHHTYDYQASHQDRDVAFCKAFSKLRRHHCPEKSKQEMFQIGRSFLYAALKQEYPSLAFPDDLVEADFSPFTRIISAKRSDRIVQTERDISSLKYSLSRLEEGIAESERKIEKLLQTIELVESS